jgi:CARDB
MVRLHIANTVTDLVLGDVQEHLPLERIPLDGDVLGLGTSSGWDNGELSFICDDPSLHGNGPWREPGLDGAQEAGTPCRTQVIKSEPQDGSLRRLRPGSGLQHFPYVCFSDDATALRRPVPIALLDEAAGRPLQEVIAGAISAMHADGTLEAAPIYGLRLLSRWHSLVITVASKLCMGQWRRNGDRARIQALGKGGDAIGATIYERLPHFRLSQEDPGDPADPVRWLGRSLTWECCGFWDNTPELGRVTVPSAGAHLHLHGCSTDLRCGGHLHHEHPGTSLEALDRLVLYPLTRIASLGSDLAVRDAVCHQGELQFTVVNQGNLDVSDVGVAVVIDDRYSDHRHLPLPWLAAGEAERVCMTLDLPPGRHQLAVIVDPERRILEEESRRGNNAAVLEVEIPA